ncbi:hypothetical protein CWI37_1987p0010 [Hamiltosporidium tvaerminnensis]|uniref:Uncharacterized protein n=1 Tax=Hamiltosporidium tvaerminnensis TaxID=1176355 RepID=A0A4Q9KV85_9MICR|nr:hypothetical protein CWI37_1987p0010 [Hamiltosporidium tvaerminnensis]
MPPEREANQINICKSSEKRTKIGPRKTLIDAIENDPSLYNVRQLKKKTQIKKNGEKLLRSPGSLRAVAPFSCSRS